MTAKSRSGTGRFLYVAVSVAALGGLLFGYDTGVISGAILFIKKDFALSSTMQELVVSVVLVGALLGAGIGGWLADRFGRRWVIVAAGVGFSVGAVGTAFAPSVGTLMAGRVVVGIAIGAASLTTPMYISEIAPPAFRGSLVSINQLALTSGIVLAYLVDYGFSAIGGWRYMLGIAGFPSLVLAIAMWRMPSSPRWLASKGRDDESRSTLQHIRGNDDISAELGEVEASLAKQKASNAMDLLHPALRMAFIVGVGLAVFQQITGINTVIYYAPTIFQFAGVGSAGSSILATLIVGVVNVAFTAVAFRLIDRVGRRPLLLVGLAGQILGLVILGLAFTFKQLGTSLGYMAIASLAIYVASFAVGLGPVFWLMISEIYPQNVRGPAMGIATMANWGFNLVVAVTFLSLVGALGRPGTFWLYAAIGFAAWTFVLLLVPETRGKTLEQIEEHWHAGKHPLEMGGAGRSI